MKYIILIAILAMSVLSATAAIAANTDIDTAGIASILQSIQESIVELSRKVRVHISGRMLTATVLEADITKDGTVGPHDWEYMQSKWFTDDKTADINGDGVVNSIDFGLLNKNWNKSVN